MRVDVNCLLCSVLVVVCVTLGLVMRVGLDPTLTSLVCQLCACWQEAYADCIMGVGLDLTLTSLEVIVSRSSPLSSSWIVVASSVVLGSLCEGLAPFDFARLGLA